MPKIRLIKVFDNTCACCDYIQNVSVDPYSEWEEVTEEELAYLTSNEGNKVLNPNSNFYHKVIVFKDETNTGKVQDFIHDIKNYIKKEKEKLEKAKTKKQKMLEEKKAKMEMQKIEKAKKLLIQAGIKVDE